MAHVFATRSSFPRTAEELKEKVLKRASTTRKEPDKRKYPRISKPVELLKNSYDVVVIGSGYGGGVAASRMARGRQSVCVLELGRERWPGEFPETLSKAMKELHISGDFAPFDTSANPVAAGDATSLYHLILGEGQHAFVANGLGGTSLLNANVFLEADHKTLAMSSWPEEIRTRPGCLDRYYRRARDMLQPEPYPDDFPELAKLKMLRKQAAALGLESKFRKVDQTTRFKDGLNSSGVHMNKSTLSGMDSTGLNDGSKSSTLVNYIADAWNWGAEIFCRCEVRYIKKHPKEGYLVYFAWHGARRDKFSDIFYGDLMWVHAKKFVFLGAGALGTTEILLRSKEMGMPMNDNIGQNMSGNGDMLAFGYNMNDTVNAMGRPHPPPEAPVGPTITGIIDCRDQQNPLDGFVIEEGAITEPLIPLIQNILELLPGRIRPEHLSRGARMNRLMASASSRLLGYYYSKGSLEKTQVYLIMCHDDNQAILTLQNDKPRLEFKGVGRAEHVRRLNEKLKEATLAEGGTFVNNPFFAALGEQEITVHPIGGASMSRDGTAENGVTNHVGEVLTGNGTEVYKGLAVVDASAIPTALGANPFATITALAERSVERLALENGIKIKFETKNGKLDLFHQPEYPLLELQDNKDEDMIRNALRNQKEGLEFTEIMTGHIHIGSEIKEFEVAERLAKGQCAESRFFLSVHAYDTKTFLSTAEHKAMLTGTFTSGSLPASPYMVVGGEFQLFNEDKNTPETKNLTYDFDMIGTDGSKIHFYGYKVINDVAAFSILGTWKATTTLNVTLSEPKENDESEPKIIGRGILVINPFDFVRELKSFYSSVYSASHFVSYFVKELAHVFFAPFDFLTWPGLTYETWSQKNHPTNIFALKAGDGVASNLKVWEPDQSTKPRNMDLLFIPGAAVDEAIFALPTIKTNAITFFRKKGYRCFCVTHRVGRTPVARQNYTTFDARLDIKAAIEKIASLRYSSDYRLKTKKTYIIAHCAGSIALSAGLLNGDIDTSSIAGITASNVFMTPRFPPVNSIKASSPLPLTSTYKFLTRSEWYDCTSTPTDTWTQLALNPLLRFYPVPTKSDFCTSVVCHRASLPFGMLYSHHRLNEATHKQLHCFLGGTSMKSLKHLITMGKQGRVIRTINSAPDELVNDANIDRLKGIPILLFSGDENCVYTPECTNESYSMLRERLGEQWFERELFPKFGHLDCWMSEDSEVVYKRVNGHIDTVAKMMEQSEHLTELRGANGTTAHADENGSIALMTPHTWPPDQQKLAMKSVNGVSGSLGNGHAS